MPRVPCPYHPGGVCDYPDEAARFSLVVWDGTFSLVTSALLKGLVPSERLTDESQLRELDFAIPYRVIQVAASIDERFHELEIHGSDELTESARTARGIVIQCSCGHSLVQGLGETRATREAATAGATF